MIKLLLLYPDHLDLNGDAGNLLVLAKRIEWGGLQAQARILHPGQNPIERPDVLLIGHGSTAAWKQVYAELARLAPTVDNWLREGTQVIAVSSGFAALHGLLTDLPATVERGERKSTFVAEDFEGERIFGYLNSDLNLPNIIRYGNLLGTMLHGPLFAKNSNLADGLIEKVKGSLQRTEVAAEKFDFVENLEVAARKLAQEQAES